jgi:hypothetical protein
MSLDKLLTDCVQLEGEKQDQVEDILSEQDNLSLEAVHKALRRILPDPVELNLLDDYQRQFIRGSVKLTLKKGTEISDVQV